MDGQMSIFDFPEYLPEEPKQEILEVSIRGMLDDGYCPKCNIWLDDLVEECPECHSKLDWTWWKKVNEVDE